MRRAVTIATVLVGATLGAVFAGFGGFARGDRPPVLPSKPTLTDAQVPERVAPAPQSTRRLGALVQRRTILRRSPGGRRVGTIGRRTRFKSRQLLAVVARRGAWLGVLHPRMPNGRAGWIPRSAVRLVQSPWEIEIDRSAKVARVRYGGRFAARFPVAVGRSSSPTPLGRFAVTDRITTRGVSPYGCCILAITGRQGKLPQGWTGGDRLALHGSPTDSVGGAVSSGCVRLERRALRWMMRRVPAGTRVDVVA